MLLGILTGAVLMAQATSFAAAPAPPPAPDAPKASVITYAPAKAADQKDTQLVCKMEKPIGSNIPVRRCRSVGDMKDKALQDRLQIEHAQQNISMR